LRRRQKAAGGPIASYYGISFLLNFFAFSFAGIESTLAETLYFH